MAFILLKKPCSNNYHYYYYFNYWFLQFSRIKYPVINHVSYTADGLVFICLTIRNFNVS